MKHIFVDPPPKFVSRSHAVLRRGRSGYEITSLSSSHSLSQLLIYTFCFITMRAALFLSQTFSAIKNLFRLGAYLLPFKITTVS